MGLYGVKINIIITSAYGTDNIFKTYHIYVF